MEQPGENDLGSILSPERVLINQCVADRRRSTCWCINHDDTYPNIIGKEMGTSFERIILRYISGNVPLLHCIAVDPLIHPTVEGD